MKIKNNDSDEEILFLYKIFLISRNFSENIIERYMMCVRTFFEWRKKNSSYSSGYIDDLILFLETFDFTTTNNAHTECKKIHTVVITIDEKNFYIKALKILYVKILKKKFIYLDYDCPKNNINPLENNRQRIINFVTIFYYKK